MTVDIQDDVFHALGDECAVSRVADERETMHMNLREHLLGVGGSARLRVFEPLVRNYVLGIFQFNSDTNGYLVQCMVDSARRASYQRAPPAHRRQKGPRG